MTSSSCLYSIKTIEQQLCTGEEPVVVLCSDLNTYICKYMRSSASSYKLACELIGSIMATAWDIETPDIAFVRIMPEHWDGLRTPHSVTAPTLGSRRLEGVIDITPSSYREVEVTSKTLRQLIKIALFDFWIANEDRNANNANLLYDINRKCFVSIDYGCILNTATFDFPLSQLTSTDTILWSDLFLLLSKGIRPTDIDDIIRHLKEDLELCLKKSRSQSKTILSVLPKEWKVPADSVREKLEQLFDSLWVSGVWNNFVENLKDNIK